MRTGTWTSSTVQCRAAARPQTATAAAGGAGPPVSLPPGECGAVGAEHVGDASPLTGLDPTNGALEVKVILIGPC